MTAGRGCTCERARRIERHVTRGTGRTGRPPGRTGRAEGVALHADEDLIAEIDFAKSGDGLVAAVVQDATDGTVLTVAYMDAEALRRTVETGRSWFYSRSRQEYWQKGETSGDRQYVREVRMDCDGDALVVLVDQHGKGACHTGERSCFYRTVGQGPGVPRP